jgi:hypothetical protein
VNDVVLRYNYVECHHPDDHFMMHDGDSTSSSTTDIHNNVYVNTASTHMYVMLLGNEPGPIGTINIYNNTFVLASQTWPDYSGFAQMGNGPPKQINFYSNIYHRATLSGQGDFWLPGLGLLGTFDYNLYDSSPSLNFNYNSGSNTAIGLANWRSASGKDAHSIATSDPLFVASGTGAAYFRLRDNSPGKALGSGGQEVGAWGGASQVGCSFGGPPGPNPPLITNVT